MKWLRGTDMEINEIKALLDKWPKAVDPELICDIESESQKLERAGSIISFFVDENLAGKKFLDFGCGEGHTISAAEEKGATAVGYDIVKSGVRWNDNSKLFTDWDSIKKRGPYDVVMIYDVLDHAESPIECLKNVKSVLSPNGTIYLLTHPWCSRHGGHIYREFNYAFAHLILTSVELAALGVSIDVPKQKVVNPILTYKNWINNSELKMVSTNIIKDTVEKEFGLEPSKTRLLKAFKEINSSFKDLPKFQMEQSFHEFVVKVK